MSNETQAVPKIYKATLANGKTYDFCLKMGLARKVSELSGLDVLDQNSWKSSTIIGHAIVWATMSMQDKKEYTAEEVDEQIPLHDSKIQSEVGIAVSNMITDHLRGLQAEAEKKLKESKANKPKSRKTKSKK